MRSKQNRLWVEPLEARLVLSGAPSLDPGPDLQDVIKQIKEQNPHIQLIVLAEDIVQKEEVKACGADSVLLKGFPAQKLSTIVENIVDCQEDTPTVHAYTEGGTNANQS